MPVSLDAATVSSYARRVGSTVRVVLLLPTASVPAELEPDRTPVWLRFESNDADLAFRVPAEVTGVDDGWQVVATADRAALPPGLWRLKLRVGPGGPRLRVAAALLTSDTQPIALLPGPRPHTRMPPPAPRGSA